VRVAVVWGLLSVVGAAVAGCANESSSGDALSTTSPTPPVTEFLDAWERHFASTWVVEGTTRRSRTDGSGSELNGEFREVQQPPNRLRLEQGILAGELDGRRVQCTSEPLRCVDLGLVLVADPPTAAAGYAAFVEGPDAPYELRSEPGDAATCFVLLALPAPLQPELGDEVSFCFDDATGAMATSRRVSDGVIVEQSAERVSGIVTDADFVLPAPLA
jgi:hypothetical protein